MGWKHDLLRGFGRSTDAHPVVTALQLQLGHAGLAHQVDQLSDLIECHAMD
jgi:hypothetical protein